MRRGMKQIKLYFTLFHLHFFSFVQARKGSGEKRFFFPVLVLVCFFLLASGNSLFEISTTPVLSVYDGLRYMNGQGAKSRVDVGMGRVGWGNLI